MWWDFAKFCSACRELWNKMGAEDHCQCPQSANALWILSPWGVCSVFSLRDVPSVYSPFHGHVFPSSVLSMVFVIEKQLCVALCSLCAISFLWSSFPVLPCPHLFSGFEFLCKGVWKTFLGSFSGISSTNRLEREFLWHKTMLIFRDSLFVRMLRLAATNEQISLREAGEN